MSAAYTYAGDELRLFAEATNWKRYFSRQLRPYVTGAVAEVGAGIGGTTALLGTAPHDSWLCLEPDTRLADTLRQRIARGELPLRPEVVVGFLRDLPATATFDTILYIDVLEHIAADRREVAEAAARLRPGGRLVVLCPAHNGLYSAFDLALGHLRRYDRRSLEALCPEELTVVDSFYLDTLGIVVSLGAKLTRRATPTAGQIAFWDKVVVPVSRIADAWTGRRLGKTVVVVFARPERSPAEVAGAGPRI
jgi:SAM-dependent methyltransferase